MPGVDKPASVDIEFKHLPRQDIRAYFDALENQTDGEALQQIIVGWKGVDAPFSAENLQSLLDNYPAAAGELFDSFRRELLESRRKN